MNKSRVHTPAPTALLASHHVESTLLKLLGINAMARSAVVVDTEGGAAAGGEY